VGREGTALLPVNDPMFGTRLIKVETEIDEKSLEAIARGTGGEYFRAQDERGLREIFKRIDQLERTKIMVERHTHYEEHYFWFAWAALAVLLIEALWMNGFRVKIP
jgi:Ca-activated chloride channel family protein